jgi:DNA polymerase-3 subunit chi
MTRIDFYILPDAQVRSRPLLACRLADKAYRLGHRVYIHTESREQAAYMDDLLWTFSQGSFLPHALAEATGEPPPILIGHDAASLASTNVLINLAGSVPSFFDRFERVAEIVDQSDAQKQVARERYRFYRVRGYALQSHNVPTPGIET